MLKRILILMILGIVRAVAQNPSNITFPTPTLTPPYLAVDSYTRAASSMSLQPGFTYGPITGAATNLLNLNISTNPPYVSGGYLGSSVNPKTDYCTNQPLPDPAKPVGETKGHFAVSPSGAATYNIPIVISPGTKGVQPNLSINYNSQAGLGIVGTEWMFSGLSVIERVPKTAAFDTHFKGITLGANDVFALDGNRLFALSGTYGQSGTTYYTENETFATITSYNTAGSGPEKFEIKDKKGNTLKYGNANNSSLTGPGNASALAWYLNEVIDEFGNYMKYTYKQLNGEIVIDKIEYTGNSAAFLTPYNRVQFEYIPLAEKTTYFVGGVQFQKSQLLKSISSYAGSLLVRRYVLEYNWDMGTYLDSVKEIDSDGNELNPTYFCWDNPADNFVTLNSQNAIAFTNPSDYLNLTAIPADMNGDGFSDYVCFNAPTGARLRVLHNEFKNNMYSGTINFSTQYDQQPIDPKSYHLSSNVMDENNNNKQEVLSIISDINGYLSSPGLGTYSKSYYILKTAENAAGAVTVQNLGNFGTSQYFNVNFSPSQFFYNWADYTGDGIGDNIHINPEFILFKDGTLPTVFSFPLATGSIARPFSFNNDGVMDYIILNNTSPGTMNIGIVTFNGAGLVQGYTPSYGFPGNTIPNKMLNNFGFGDFNGDGFDDLLYINENRDEMFIRWGNGSAFSGAAKVTAFTPLATNVGINIKVEDIDGDGKDDVIITDSSVQPANSTTNNCFTYFSLGDNMIKGFSYSGDWTHTAVDDIFYGAITVDTDGCTSFYQNQKSTEVITGNVIHGADFNGDGVFDMTSFGAPGQEFTATNNAGGKVKRVIGTIRTPLRKEISINYANINSEIYVDADGKQLLYKKESGTSYAYPLFNFKTNMYCVSKTYESSGYYYQFYKTTRYSYSDAIYHTLGKGFLGFEKIYAVDDKTMAGSLTKAIFNTQFNVPLVSERTSGKVISQPVNGFNDYVLDNTKLITKELNTYQLTLRNPKSFFAELQSVTSKDYLKSVKTKADFTYDVNSAGNVVSKSVDYGWSGPVIKNELSNYTYTLNNGSYKIKSELNVRTQAGDPGYSRSAEYNYDATGHLTSAVQDQNIIALAPGRVRTTTYSQFNAFGSPTLIVISAPDISPSRSSQVNFDPTGRFVIKETNALGNFKEYVYEDRYGNLIQEKDITA
jgi:hypothetical protein